MTSRVMCAFGLLCAYLVWIAFASGAMILAKYSDKRAEVPADAWLWESVGNLAAIFGVALGIAGAIGVLLLTVELGTRVVVGRRPNW